MKIKQVEELVGISRKNIRFYEEQGLLSPPRAENGYREYHSGEVKRLKQIKLLRKLSVPIEEIRKVLSGEKSLEACLDRHVDALERKKDDLERMQAISMQLIGRHASLDGLDPDSCLEEIERLEKEGTQFMDAGRTDIHRKKTAGAFTGAAIITALMAVLVLFMVWANTQDPIPLGILLFFIGIPIAVVVCVLAALAARIKEIKGGEEDEASKY